MPLKRCLSGQPSADWQRLLAQSLLRALVWLPLEQRLGLVRLLSAQAQGLLLM